jgi:meiotically up-regulated gene 157 (Mug157) protein
MTTRRDFLKKSALSMGGLVIGHSILGNVMHANGVPPIQYICKRPSLDARKFKSQVVNETIVSIKNRIKDPKLAWMFENCFPNTIDTTVEHKIINGRPDTFVLTGDIHAMWLRDSSAQVFPYIALANREKSLQNMLAGVINRQTQCILIDPYANAFNASATGSEWESDHTVMKKELHERKWEIDSLCYPIRLAYNYWKQTKDTSVFNSDWVKAMDKVYLTFVEQQRKENFGPYKFTRNTDRQGDTLLNFGWGSPVNPVGMIVSSFRPSDDATLFGFLIPSNLFAVKSLRQLSEIMISVKNDTQFAHKCNILADEVEHAVNKYGVFEHPKYGKIYAFEVDGFGSRVFMDDANVPSLLALPFLECVSINDPIYQNTRKLVLSKDNPYFFKGKIAEGIGGPHIGFNYIWPMSLIMRAQTSTNNDEIRYCIRTLRDTDADTGFMHEAFHVDDSKNFTRSWFAWVNTLFGELIMKLVENGKGDILNSL